MSGIAGDNAPVSEDLSRRLPRTVRDDGEPMSAGRLSPKDRRRIERRALGDALLAAALFGGVVLVGGVLGIVLIALFQSLGWWGMPT